MYAFTLVEQGPIKQFQVYRVSERDDTLCNLGRDTWIDEKYLVLITEEQALAVMRSYLKEQMLRKLGVLT